MTTVAEDLLNDFEDSGSDAGEGHEEAHDALYGDGIPEEVEREVPNMELDDDEEEPDDGAVDDGAPSHLKLDEAEDEEATKARVEKLQLANVSDVRSVALLMKQLKPALEVSLASCSAS